MLTALLVFLVGCLVLCVFIYVIKLVIGMLGLPAPIDQIALLIFGLIGLVILFMLASSVYHSGGSIPW